MKPRNKRTDIFKLADAFYQHLERETNMEFGGWGIDDKRPFGNSSVHYDILEIIGVEPESDGGYGKWYSSEQIEYADELYNALGNFLKAEWKKHRRIYHV